MSRVPQFCLTPIVVGVYIASAGATAQDSAAVSAGLSLEEVVVTARKREESLLEVPVAANVLSANQMALEAVRNIEEVMARSPGVDLARIGSPFADQVSVRGAGQGRQINAESATGLYRNGSFIGGGNIGGSTFSRMDLFDVGSVEVYRGPQGASFGRNALGGAINVNSARPTDEQSGSVSVQYGENERFEGRAIYNTPISENVNARFGAMYVDQQDGFYFNEFDSSALDQEQFLGLRGSIDAQLGEKSSLFLVAEYFDEEQPSFAVRSHVEGDDPFNRNFNNPSEFERDDIFLQAIFETEFALGDFTSITYYRNRESSTVDDLDAQQGNNYGDQLPPPPLGFAGDTLRTADEDFTRWGQEIRLASRENGSAFNWVVGGEVLRLESDYNQAFTGFAGPLQAFNSDVSSESRDWNFAVFGLLGYEFSQTLSATAELRYTQDQKEVDIFSILGAGPFERTEEFAFDETFDNISPVLTLTWQPADTVTTYIRYSTGYRPGGFNLTPDPVPPPDYSLVYAEETASNYEFGLKTSALDGAFNFAGALFWVEGEDVIINDQLIIGQFPASRTINFVFNGGETELVGIEINADYLIEFGEGGPSLRFVASGTAMDGEFTSSPDFISPNVDDIKGLDLPFISDYTASLATTLTLPIAGSGMLGTLTHSFTGRWGGNDGILPGQFRDDVLLHDFRAALSTDGWQVAAGLKNAFDDDSVGYRGPNTVNVIDPRIWYAEATLRW